MGLMNNDIYITTPPFMCRFFRRAVCGFVRAAAVAYFAPPLSWGGARGRRRIPPSNQGLGAGTKQDCASSPLYFYLGEEKCHQPSLPLTNPACLHATLLLETMQKKGGAVQINCLQPNVSAIVITGFCPAAKTTKVPMARVRLAFSVRGQGSSWLRRGQYSPNQHHTEIGVGRR